MKRDTFVSATLDWDISSPAKETSKQRDKQAREVSSMLCANAQLDLASALFASLHAHHCLLSFTLGCFSAFPPSWPLGYQDPRVLRNESYGCEVDVFSYGVTVYELLHGSRPWRSNNNGGGGDDAGAGATDMDQSRFNELPISNKLSPVTASFLNAILAPDWRVRLGCRPRKVQKDGSFSPADQRVQWEEVKSHPFFIGIDWDALYRKEITPPFIPDNSRANCSPEADLADQLLDHKPRKITEEQQKNFSGWDFQTQLGPAKPANAWSDNSKTNVNGNANHNAAATAQTVPVTVAAANGHAAAAAAPALGQPVLHDQTKPTQASPSPSPVHAISSDSPQHTGNGAASGAHGVLPTAASHEGGAVVTIHAPAPTAAAAAPGSRLLSAPTSAVSSAIERPASSSAVHVVEEDAKQQQQMQA